MPSKRSDYADQASSYWRQNQPLEAGRLLFTRVPPEERVRWAARILELVVERTGVRPPAIERILRIAGDPNEWRSAHEAFSDARDLTLQVENVAHPSAAEKLLLRHALLAELVAKVIYNASNPADEFDEDSGWWIAVSLKEVLDSVKDEEFSRSMWAALSGEHNTKPSVR